MAHTNLALAEAPAPAMPTVTRHWTRIAPMETNAGGLQAADASAVPTVDLERAQRELQAALAPCGPMIGAKLCMLLTGPYDRREINDPKVYAGFMTDILAKVPADIGKEAVAEVVRTCKWLPKPADVAAVVDRLLGKRRMMLATVETALSARSAPQDKPRGKRWADMTLDERVAFDARLEAMLGHDVRNRSEAHDGI